MNLFKKSLLSPVVALFVCTTVYSDDISYSIEKQSLKEAIELISKKSNTPYIANSSLLDGKTSKAIKDVNGTQNALDKILENSGLEAVMEDGAIIIKKKIIIGSGTVLEEVSVNEGIYLPIGTTEGSGSYTTKSMNSATKLNLSIKDTPQSVKVITNQQIEDRNWESLEDIVSNIAGIYPLKYDSDRTHIYARGFEIDYYQLDGVPTAYSGYQEKEDLSIYDRVEIVKGANGLMSGAGNPAASINLVRKHANSKKFTGNLTLEGGSWDTYKETLDITTPLNEDGSVRARVVASHKDEKSYKDYYSKETNVFYGIVDADISDNTSVSLGASYQENNPKGTTWGGVPAWFSDGSATSFSPSDSFTPEWTYWNTKTKIVFTNLEHYFDNDIKIHVNYSHIESNSDLKMAVLGYSGSPDKNTGLGMSGNYLWNSDSKISSNVLDAYTSIPFNFVNKEHELIIGISYNKQNNDEFSQNNTSAIDISGNSVFSWNSNISEPSWSERARNAENATEQQAVYVVGRFALVDNLHLITGSRMTNYEFDDKFSNFSYEHKNVLTPYAGLVYDINENHTAYVSYTDIFKPQSNRDKSGNYLDSKEGENYEVGVKGEYFDGNLNAGLTLFRVEQDNVAQTDSSGAFIPGTITVASIGVEGVTSKGIEIDVSGAITDNWNVGVGFSNYEAKDADNQDILTESSRNQLFVSSTYTLGKVTLGGNVNWQSDFYRDGIDPLGKSVKREQESLYLVNAMAKYAFSKELSFQLNVNNLFDKEYYQTIVYGNQYVFGDPRNATLSMKYSF